MYIYISTHSIGPCYATRTRQLHCTIFTYAVTVTRRTHIPNEASPSDSRTPLIRLASKLSFDCIACFANRDDSPNRGGEDQAAGKMRINRPIPPCLPNSTATHDPSSDAGRLFTAAAALKPTSDHTWILATVNRDTHPRHAIATRLSHLFLASPPSPSPDVSSMSADRCVSSRDASYPSPPFLNPSLEKNHFFRGGSEGSPVTETTITSSMRRMVVVDPWRGDTRGDTRSFVDLLDGVHATTSNAHGPAAFSPRTRCRSASRREMMVRPGVSSSTHAPYLYALRGADGLRADHFYLTRSRTDWLSAGTGRE